MVVYSGVGIVAGGIVGILLTPGGRVSIRKVFMGFGAGTGMGCAWTNTNVRLETMLAPYVRPKPVETPPTKVVEGNQ